MACGEKLQSLLQSYQTEIVIVKREIECLRPIKAMAKSYDILFPPAKSSTPTKLEKPSKIAFNPINHQILFVYHGEFTAFPKISSKTVAKSCVFDQFLMYR